MKSFRLFADIAAAPGLLLCLVFAGCGLEHETVTQAPLPPPPAVKPPEYVSDPAPALVLSYVSLDVENLPLSEVAVQVGRAANVEVIVEEKLDPERRQVPVTLRLRHVRVGSALAWTLKGSGLALVFDGSRVLVTESPRTTFEQQAQAAEFRQKLHQAWRPELERKLAGPDLSCDLQNVPLPDLFEFLYRTIELNCIAQLPPGQTPPPVTLKLTGASPSDILNALASQLHMQWELHDEVILFSLDNT